ncbi:hypothetical protein [Caballeronia novacaledonica]|uniref:Uncharacterized protein n=1 Tax=Caballeronia novacaledonica TaxID=1544861 RepID=A0AA37IFC5_9BURK|nr:hypothetical protein [Caballeronia novacaledonica]GJH28147.1 hypothetical protein CBA19CS42_26545 [Caballeronia novacaledonica]
MSLFSFLKPTHDVSLTYVLDGIEKNVFGQTEDVLDSLQVVAAALTLFPLKGDSTPEPSMKSLYALTDGMTAEQVQKSFEEVIAFMDDLKAGKKEAPFHADGRLTISRAGALLTCNDTSIGFPFQGATQRMPAGYVQRRIAVTKGNTLHLSLTIDGGDEVESLCTWIVDHATGSMAFSLREARYWQIKDYGRVLLNQTIEASGNARR